MEAVSSKGERSSPGCLIYAKIFVRPSADLGTYPNLAGRVCPAD